MELIKTIFQYVHTKNVIRRFRKDKLSFHDYVELKGKRIDYNRTIGRSWEGETYDELFKFYPEDMVHTVLNDSRFAPLSN